ncbi:MAG: HD domain-containing protein [Candidatus Omnitrophota bacterium]
MGKTIKINIDAFNNIRADDVLKSIDSVSCRLGGKVYLVGGVLRDLFIKKEIVNKIDWDFSVSSGALALGQALAKQLNAAFIVLDDVNKIARVVYTKSKKRYTLDFAEFRARTLKGDLRRRDFTLNTLSADVRALIEGAKPASCLIDYFGGVRDIKNKCVRITRKENFKDDALRILRGFSFCAQFGFNFDKATAGLIKKNSCSLKAVSAERISEELVKIFSINCSGKYITQMDKQGIIKAVLPETNVLRGAEQGLFHHLDVWEHSLETLIQLEKLLKSIEKKIPRKYFRKLNEYLNQPLAYERSRLWVLKLSALLHDLGKPATKVKADDGTIHFYTHERIGADTAEKIGRRLKLSLREITVLKNLVRYHLRPGQLVNRMPSQKAKFRFFRDTKEDAVLILLLTISDRRAMRGPLSRRKSFVFLEEELFKMIAAFFRDKEKRVLPPKLLNGDDIIKILKVSSGPMIGNILRQIEEAQAEGSIKNKKDAKGLALRIYQEVESNG